jgi:hypothetical protein
VAKVVTSFTALVIRDPAAYDRQPALRRAESKGNPMIRSLGALLSSGSPCLRQQLPGVGQSDKKKGGTKNPGSPVEHDREVKEKHGHPGPGLSQDAGQAAATAADGLEQPSALPE